MKKIRAEDLKKGIEKTIEKISALLARLRAFGARHPKLATAIEYSRKKAKDQVQKHGAEFFARLATLVLCMYFASDITVIAIQKFLPDLGGAKPSLARTAPPVGKRQITDYEIVYSRNLFNSKGLIPGEALQQDKSGNGPAMKTTLPLALVGTIIFEVVEHSVATLQDKSADRIYPVQADDEVPGMLRVTKIEPYKVTFFNLRSQRNEYIDLPEEQSFSPVITPRMGAAQGGEGIKKLSSTRIVVSKDKLDATLGNLDKVLTEARVVPNFEGGAPAGFRMIQIVPGSFYDEAGFQNNDILMGVNGEAIDAQKAFGMLNELKEMKHVEIQVKRNGRDMTLSFDIE